jgi:phosphotriesterase-related protein
MSVMTVRGPVSEGELGIVLAHEHLFMDLRNQFTPFEDPESARISSQKVCMANLGRLRRNPYAVRDNLVLDDPAVMAREASAFKEPGGRTIVECTSIGIGRDARALKELADSTGLHVIAGCGYYTQDTHPPQMSGWNAEEVAAQMVRDLAEGMDGTDIRAGVIGEIGTSDPVRPDEWKVLEAAALAHDEMGAAVYVHTYPWGTRGLEAADFLIRRGVPPQKVVICHADVEPRLDYIRELLGRGVFVEFDDFGKEFCVSPSERGFAGGGFAGDPERVRLLRGLLDAGYERQLLITNDICFKSMLSHYGGWGYGHILRHVVPMLRAEGADERAIQTLLQDNPRRLLASARGRPPRRTGPRGAGKRTGGGG